VSASFDRRRRSPTVGGMPRKIRELIRLVEDDGWYLVGQTGSHRQYKHRTKPGRVTIAGKPSVEVPPKTEKSILRQAGLEGGAQ
jgi:predicted RNA binding protein YcfA (HicA-like mRNA interferase family)